MGELVYQGATHTADPARDTEKSMVYDCIRELDRKDLITEHDRVIVAHNAIRFGYGKGWWDPFVVDGRHYGGATVYSRPGVSDWEPRCFTHQELEHTFGARHRHGGYVLKSDGYTIDRISPLATAYVFGHRSKNSRILTNEVNHDGGMCEDAPDKFEGRERRRNFEFTLDIDDLPGNHQMNYTSETLGIIDDTLSELN